MDMDTPSPARLCAGSGFTPSGGHCLWFIEQPIHLLLRHIDQVHGTQGEFALRALEIVRRFVGGRRGGLKDFVDMEQGFFGVA